jgi:hypothetical protein
MNIQEYPWSSEKIYDSGFIDDSGFIQQLTVRNRIFCMMQAVFFIIAGIQSNKTTA